MQRVQDSLSVIAMRSDVTMLHALVSGDVIDAINKKHRG